MFQHIVLLVFSIICIAIPIYWFAYNYNIRTHIKGKVTECVYNDKNELTTIRFTYIYNGKLYGPYDDTNPSLLSTCTKDAPYDVVIDTNFPNHYSTTPTLDTVTSVFLTTQLLLGIVLAVVYYKLTASSAVKSV
jgi:hypothetical protein